MRGVQSAQRWSRGAATRPQPPTQTRPCWASRRPSQVTGPGGLLRAGRRSQVLGRGCGLPCAPCRRPALSPSLFSPLSLKGQGAGSARPAPPGRGGRGARVRAPGRALTPLLPQVLRVLAHPQLGLHTGFRLIQDVLEQSTASRGGHARVPATNLLPSTRTGREAGLRPTRGHA